MDKLKRYEVLSTIKSLLKDSSTDKDNIELIDNILHDNDYLSFSKTCIISLLCYMPLKFKDLVVSKRFDKFQLGEIANELTIKTIKTSFINLNNNDEINACLDYIESFTKFSHTYYIKENSDESVVNEFLEKLKDERYVTQEYVLKLCCEYNQHFISIIDFDKIDQDILMKTICNIHNYGEHDIDEEYFDKYKSIFFDSKYRLADKITDISLLDKIVTNEFSGILEDDITQYIIDGKLFSIEQIKENEEHLSVETLTIIESKLIERNNGKYSDIFGLSERYNEFGAYDWYMLTKNMCKEDKESLVNSTIFLDSIKNIIKKEKNEKYCIYHDIIIDAVIKNIDEFQLVYNLNADLIYDVYLKEIGLFYNTSFRTICLPKLSSSHWMRLIPKNKKYYEHYKQLLKQGETNE